MLLSEIKTGESAVIIKVNGSGAFRKRILEMGFVKGKTVKAVLNAPLKDPIKYKIMDYEVSLRRSEAALIEVVYPNLVHTEETQAFPEVTDINSVIDTDESENIVTRKNGNSKTINVALVGNPNSGKTTLFNYVSGAHEHVGNYSGVTVDSKEGVYKYGGYTFNIVDLPGTYSLSAYTPEELFVRKHLIENKPDVVINIVAASNLERNLYLTTELIELKNPTVIALNMYDELVASGSKFDHEKLSKLMGIPMVPTVSKKGEGIDKLFEKVIQVYNNEEEVVRCVNIPYGNQVENAISRLNIKLEKNKSQYIFPIRFLSVKLLEKDDDVESYIKSFENYESVLKLRDDEVKVIEERFKEDIESLLTNARYGFIAGGLKETLEEKNFESDFTRVLDSAVTSKVWGFPIFFAFMFLMFACTFLLGEYPMGWIESIVGWISSLFQEYMPDGMLKDLIVDGIIGGVGAVIVFLPNIMILYAFISFMEDSGYMARAAFIMDRVMHKMGLHGKSFIPLIMGFGCNVPAILASRTIESRNSRMITILVNPFMSCSARLPVYLLFAGVFFKAYAPLVLFGLYFGGILLAVLSARLFRRFLFKGEDTPFVMELPPYRMPTLKAVLIHMWDKAKLYLKKMGGIILVASIIIWFFGYFPKNEHIIEKYDAQIAQIEASSSIDDEVKELQITELEHHKNTEYQENSYIGILGKAIEPVVAPLGFDWKIGISLVSGLAAKEVIVSTLGVIYAGDSEDEDSLKTILPQELRPDGTKVFSTLTIISLLLFVLIYFPCVATIAAIKQETGSWKWGIFSMVYTTVLAWLISFVVYQGGSLLGF